MALFKKLNRATKSKTIMRITAIAASTLLGLMIAPKSFDGASKKETKAHISPADHANDLPRAEQSPAANSTLSGNTNSAKPPAITAKQTLSNDLGQDPITAKNTFTGYERIQNSPILREHISPKDAFGNYSVTKIVETDFKYPLIQVVEHFSEHTPSSPRLIQRSYMVADHLVVKMRDGIDAEALQSLVDSQGYQVRKTYQDSKLALVSFDVSDSGSLETAQDFFAQHSNEIAYAEHDYLRVPTAIIPNDPSFYRQNYLDHVRDPDGSKYDQGDNIGAWQAWERRTDAQKDDGKYVLVGVIDTGIAIEHEDLINNIWENPNEVYGNDIDDDGNGFVDDTFGWNFFDDNNDYSKSGGHATHVAGIIAAEGNNGIGVSGVAWRAKLISADIFGNGLTTGADAAEATRYLVDLNVDIINASYGASEYMQVECDAIEEANAAGILFVTSAGNALRNLDLQNNDQYPAECDVDNIITVGGGSTRLHDLIDGQSNYGAQAVDIIAPIWAYSTYIWDPEEPLGSYDYSEGTSMSAPMVAGAAALIMAEHPELSHLDIKSLLMNTATRATPIEGTSQSGMLNVARAINFDIPKRAANVDSIVASSHDGNIPENAMDDDPDTRWSAFGFGETITFELSQIEVLSSLDIQWLKGDQRSAKFGIESSLDGINWEVIYGGLYRDEPIEQSSGSNAAFEHYPVLNVEAQYVRIKGFGNTTNDWNSIIETVIYVYDENTDIVLNAPTSLTTTKENSRVRLSWVDASSGEDEYIVQRRLNGQAWSILANLSKNTTSYVDSNVSTGNTYEYQVYAANNGTSGPSSQIVLVTLENDIAIRQLTISGVSASSDDGNIADNTLDKSLDTRWSAKGDGQWVDFKLNGQKTVTNINIAWYKGDQRYAVFILSAQSNDGRWVEIYNGTGSGNNLGLEAISIDPIYTDTIRYTGFGNSTNTWNSITELELEGY